MKISSTYFNNYKKGNLYAAGQIYNSGIDYNLQLHYLKDYQCDSVSFKRIPDTTFINDLRELPNLTCGCCGIKMLKNSVVNDFLNRKIYYPASIALKRIKSENYFNESHASDEMKTAYAFLKNFADRNPKLTMQDILAKKAVKAKRQTFSKEVSAACETIRDMTKLVAHNSKYMIDEISKLNPKFHKTEKKVFKELQMLAKEYPQETFYDILNKPEVNKYYLTRLQKKQIDILDNVVGAVEDAPENIKTMVLDVTEKARDIFEKESVEILHKRGRVISHYQSLLNDYKDDSCVQKVLEIINELPDSKTDSDAFLIKGAQKSSNAIVEILLSRVRSTFEHVKPHKREGDNGPSNIFNYIALCGKCNSERQRTGYDIFTKAHPEMIENEQIQINKIIHFINHGILAGYDEYPVKIKKALDIESKGAIKININKLNLLQAKNNRKLRQKKIIEKKKSLNGSKAIYKFGKGLFKRNVMGKNDK